MILTFFKQCIFVSSFKTIQNLVNLEQTENKIFDLADKILDGLCHPQLQFVFTRKNQTIWFENVFRFRKNIAKEFFYWKKVSE